MIRFITKNFVSALLVFALVFSYQFSLQIIAAPAITTVNPTAADLSGGTNITITGSGFIQNVTAGSLDTSFVVGTGAAGGTTIIRSTAVQSDGKVIIAGEFTTYNGVGRVRIARLNTDGSLDTSFVAGTGADNTIFTTAIQSDGKIIIGGSFLNYNGTAIARIARLNTDGSLDTSFVVGTGANGIVYASAIQTDGKVLIGGAFTTYNSTARARITRINTDGSLDTTYVVGGGAQNEVRTFSLQSDGKAIIGGLFTAYNGTARNRIARINTDGSLDTTYVVGTAANNTIFTSAIQSDGKVIIAGAFTTYNGSARNRAARINTNGSLDTTFTVGTGANSNVFTLSILSDGKVIVGGQFTTFTGVARNRIVRLNTNGSVDTGFVVGTATDNIVYAASLQSNDKIIIGGQFTTYGGVSRNRIARLNPNTNSISANIGANPCTTLVFNSATQLTCTLPAGASVGFADVTVINPNLESFILSGVFQYTSPPSVSFLIRNSADTSNSNNCDLGVATTFSLASCSYRLKVSADLSQGYFIYMQTSGNLISGGNSIQNAAPGAGGTGGSLINGTNTGIENYGVQVTEGNITGGTVSVNPIFDAGTNSVLYNYSTATSLLETTGPNSPSPTDTSNTTLVTHNFNISSSTRAGQYTQSVIYTVVPKF